MKERINKVGAKLHETRHVIFESGIDILVLVGRDFEILFKLIAISGRLTTLKMRVVTLNRFFSSLSDFSFLSRNFVRELLNRS